MGLDGHWKERFGSLEPVVTCLVLLQEQFVVEALNDSLLSMSAPAKRRKLR